MRTASLGESSEATSHAGCGYCSRRFNACGCSAAVIDIVLVGCLGGLARGPTRVKKRCVMRLMLVDADLYCQPREQEAQPMPEPGVTEGEQRLERADHVPAPKDPLRSFEAKVSR